MAAASRVDCAIGVWKISVLVDDSLDCVFWRKFNSVVSHGSIVAQSAVQFSEQRRNAGITWRCWDC